MTAVPFGEQTLLSIVYRDISAQKLAESEIRRLNASLEKRVAERTVELLLSNDQLKRVEQELRKRGEQVQKHRDVLLELAHSDKSDLAKALRKICSLAASTLDLARVSYWSVQENNSTHARRSGLPARRTRRRCHLNKDEFFIDGARIVKLPSRGPRSEGSF
jgi:uncharacterized protein YdgA (DUF945 family)